MTNKATVSKFASREQGYSDSPITRVDLPFRLARLPQRRHEMCRLMENEGQGYSYDVSLYLAPPGRGRPWWSVWSFVSEETWEGQRNDYEEVPLGFLRYVDGDLEVDVASYLLTQVTKECYLDPENVCPGLLDKLQIRTALRKALRM